MNKMPVPQADKHPGPSGHCSMNGIFGQLETEHGIILDEIAAVQRRLEAVRTQQPDLEIIIHGRKKEKATNVTFSFGFLNQELITVVAAATPAIPATTAAALSAATATTAATISTTAISAATTATLTRLAGPGLVDDHGAPFVLFSVHPFNGFLGFLVSTHFDKREALRPACHPVAYDFRAIHLPELREQLL
jgi:hypothetical protein